MDRQFAFELVKKLPCGTDLKKNKSKIHRLFPVPNDFEILWASVESFIPPSGIVITDRGIVLKGISKVENSIKPNHKTPNKPQIRIRRKTKPLYQLILWEYFEIEEFRIIQSEANAYTIEYSGTQYAHFSKSCLANVVLQRISDEYRLKSSSHIAFDSAQLDVFGIENVVFAAQYGANTSETGHGIYAEEAGALLDRFNLEKVEVVGRDNAKNEPDKNVNGFPIQCKYCKTATSSINNCFKPIGSGIKEYRYFDLSGKPMKVEVPKDQYGKAIEVMQKRILEGSVPGVSDPNAAYDIVREGKLTYTQARNLAKAGTIESLTYDAATGAVNCSFAFGMSALVTFAFTIMQTKNPKEAIKLSAITGLQTFGLSLVTQVLSTQIARTGLQNGLIPVSDIITNKIGSKAVQNLINSIRSINGQKPIYGAAAQKSLAKALRTSVIAQSISLIIFSVPDTIKVIRKKISGAEYVKNITGLISSSLASFGGTLVANKLIRKFAKNIPNPATNTIVYVTSAVAGIGTSYFTRKGMSIIREDDSTILRRLLDAAIIIACLDNMFNEIEIEHFLDILVRDDEIRKSLKTLMGNIYSSDKQYIALRAVLDNAAFKVVKQRKVLSINEIPDDDSLIVALSEVIDEIPFKESVII